MSEAIAAHMMTLFRGNEHAYGVYTIGEPGDVGSKQEGKAQTRSGPVVLDLWSKHLAGTQGLGIIPINSQSKCKWGAIDVDQYPFDHAELLRTIASLKLPLYVFKSKSGGAHVYYFVEHYIAASEMRKRLKEFNTLLKLGAKELFPKQATLTEGSIGNWLNMPYFGGTSRPLLRLDGEGRIVEVGLNEACDSIVAVVDADDGKRPTTDLCACPAIIGPEAPPCLQSLSLGKFPEGTRNDGLFNVALLFKKMGFTSSHQLHKANEELMDPKLDDKEVDNIWNAAAKKDFNYTCHKSPINAECNRAVCLGRKFGIKDKGGLPQLISANKLPAGDETIWDLELASAANQAKTGHIQVTAHDLINQQLFFSKCVPILDYIPAELPKAQYAAYISELIGEACTINYDGAASPQTRFRELLVEFLKAKMVHSDPLRQDFDIEPLLRGSSVEHQSQIYFKLTALEDFLRRRGLTWKRPQVILELERTYGSSHIRKRARGVDVYAQVILMSSLGDLMNDPEELPEEPQREI